MSYTRLIDDEKLSHLLQEYPYNKTDVLSRKYNLDEQQIRGLAKQFGISKAKGFGHRTPLKLHPEKLEALLESYPNTPTRILAKEFELPIHQITHIANSRGIKKAPGCARSRITHERNAVCDDLFRMYPLDSETQDMNTDAVTITNEEAQAQITISYKGRTIIVNEDERGKSVLELIFKYLM